MNKNKYWFIFKLEIFYAFLSFVIAISVYVLKDGEDFFKAFGLLFLFFQLVILLSNYDLIFDRRDF